MREVPTVTQIEAQNFIPRFEAWQENAGVSLGP